VSCIKTLSRLETMDIASRQSLAKSDVEVAFINSLAIPPRKIVRKVDSKHRKLYSIYLITNLRNGKRYVGFTGNPTSRWADHRCAAKSGAGYALHSAIRKYGVDAFDFRVIDQHHNRTFLLEVAEQLWIEFYAAGHGMYNETRGGQGGYQRKVSQEERAAMSERAKKLFSGQVWYTNGTEDRLARVSPGDGWVRGRTNQKPTNKGKKIYNNGVVEKYFVDPPEGWALGQIPGRVTEEQKRAISARNTGRKHGPRPRSVVEQSMQCVSTPWGVFRSVKEAAVAGGIAPCTLSNRMRQSTDEYRRLTLEEYRRATATNNP